MASRLAKLEQRRKDYLAQSSSGNEIDWNLAHLEDLVRAKAEAEGDIDFLNALDHAEDFALVSEAVKDHYELGMDNTVFTRGTKNPREFKGTDYGKATITSKDIHGASDTKNTINSILMALDARRHGPIVQRGNRSISAHDEKVRLAVERIFGLQAANTFSGVGLRAGSSHLPVEERLARSADRVLELDHGYNPITGAPYAGAGLDGGHKLPHSLYPELSDARENMMFENKYENRAKGKRLDEAERKAYIKNITDRFRATDAIVTRPHGHGPKVPFHVLANAWEMNAPYEVI